jgi:cyanophycin synthetase
LDLLFPPGKPARIPIVAITGTNGKTTTCRMIASILKMAGRRVGLTTTDGIYIDGTQILKGDMSGPQSAQMVLQNPTVEHAVLETARGGILRAGLGFDRCDVAVVTNVTGDHLGLGGIDTVRDLARVKAVVPASTFRDGHSVLNADDYWCREMESRARGDVIYFTVDEHNEKVQEHLRARGKAVVLRQTPRGEVIYMIDGRRETAVLDVRHIPATFEGRARVNVKNALAATGAAWGSNVSLDAIRNGLRAFAASFFQAPGRLNLLELTGFRVIVDYCHNVPGMLELVEFVRRLAPHRAIGMVAMPGDRRDEDIREFAALAASVFEEVVVREDANPRGRKRGEVAGIIRDALTENGLTADRVTIVLDELEAAESILDRARPDDLVVLLADRPAEIWELVSGRSSRQWQATPVA